MATALWLSIPSSTERRKEEATAATTPARTAGCYCSETKSAGVSFGEAGFDLLLHSYFMHKLIEKNTNRAATEESGYSDFGYNDTERSLFIA